MSLCKLAAALRLRLDRGRGGRDLLLLRVSKLLEARRGLLLVGDSAVQVLVHLVLHRLRSTVYRASTEHCSIGLQSSPYVRKHCSLFIATDLLNQPYCAAASDLQDPDNLARRRAVVAERILLPGQERQNQVPLVIIDGQRGVHDLQCYSCR